jgi:hypothetical protein
MRAESIRGLDGCPPPSGRKYLVVIPAKGHKNCNCFLQEDVKHRAGGQVFDRRCPHYCGCPVLALFARAGTVLPGARALRIRGQTRTGHYFSIHPKSQSNVTAITASTTKKADHSQGESGAIRNQPAGPKSLRLKILPLSD